MKKSDDNFLFFNEEWNINSNQLKQKQNARI